MIHKLYRVDRRTPAGWKLGICVWMQSCHLSSFLGTLGKHHRVRREAAINCNKVSFLWDGTILIKGGQRA